MRPWHLGILSLVLAGVMASPVMAQQPGDDVPFATLVMDASSAMAGARDEVVVDEARFQQVWQDVYKESPDPPPLPLVDFNLRMVIVVSLGLQPSSGSGIQITSVSLVRGQAQGYPLLLVRVVESRPGRRCIVSPTSSGPIHIIEVPRYPDVSFHRTRKTLQCR